MIVEFCKRMGLICHIFHGDAKKSNLIASYKPSGSNGHTRRVEFVVRDSHCFWYGKPPEEMGTDKRSGASNAISQFLDEPSDNEEDLDVTCKVDDCFRGREVAEVYKQDRTPPFDEWKHVGDLIEAAPTFEPPRQEEARFQQLACA